MSSQSNGSLILLLSMALLSSARAAADDSPEVLLYEADHPANAAAPQPAADTPEWMTRVVARPSIIPLLPAGDEQKRPACIICPGGGYGGLSMEKEGLEPAKWLNERGVAAFVLRYRCGGGENQQPVPLEDAQRAMRTVRARAAEWNVDPNRVGVWGFSAGGHLASSTGVFVRDAHRLPHDAISGFSTRPNYLVLIYPVISMELGTTHAGSRHNLLGPDPADELAAAWSTYRHVNDQTPPTFLVHASDDQAVPPENSLLFYQALVARKVPAEMHIFQQGGHGFGMLRGERPADGWPALLEPWLRDHGMMD